MKNIKLALLCLVLSNIYFIKSMELPEEDGQIIRTRILESDPMMDIENIVENGEKEDNGYPFVIDDASYAYAYLGENYNSTNESNNNNQQNTFSFNLNDLQQKLASLKFEQDNPPSSYEIVGEFFTSLDTYTALEKSFKYLATIDSNWDEYEDVAPSTQELIYFIVKKLNFLEDITILFCHAVEENNDNIKAAVICSRCDINKFSEHTFYKKVFKRTNRGFRKVNYHNDAMIPYLSNVHSCLILPILQLQIETNYPLLKLIDVLAVAFLNANKELIKTIFLNNLITIDPIFQAALSGDYEYLQTTDFDLNALEPLTGLSLLGFAAISNKLKIAEFLIKCGTDIELGNPLHVAAKFGNRDIIILLLRSGANINAKCNLKFFINHRPLDMALSGKHREIAQLLLELESNGKTKISDKELRETFKNALYSDDQDVAEQLLVIHSDCFSSFYLNKSDNPNNLTPLHIATQNNWTRIVKHLIDRGVILNGQTSQHGNTPLHIATNLGHHKIIRLLLNADASASKNNFYRDTPLDLAKLAFTYAKTKKEKRKALEAFKLLYGAHKTTINELDHRNSISIRSSAFIPHKKQKTKLTTKINQS